jgi:desulfoferrodoxin-like iron-binding protein
MKKGQICTCSTCGNSVEMVKVGGGKLVCCGVPMEKTAEEGANNAEASRDALLPHVILGIHITNRVQHASSVQSVLTGFGCNIKTRLGLHEVHADVCSPNGLMLIEFCGSDSECDDLVGKLVAVEGVEVKRMVFDHP